jgi:uncharacterized cupredoxin-like copper-binding protein
MMGFTERSLRIASLGVALVLAFANLGGSAASATSEGSDASTSSDGATLVRATLADTMRVTLDRYTVRAGKVLFLVTNAGKLTHELVVLKTDMTADMLTANPDVPGKVIEDLHMGETGDIDGGRFNGLELTLGPGHYVILCNELGHYMAGMHLDFTVVEPMVNVSLNDNLTITLDRATVYAGPIVFGVTNRGAMTHEFIVLATSATAADLLASSEEPGKVSEDANIGETGQIPAGRFSGLALTLEPGTYTVICNEPGHFAGGMHLELTVLPLPGGDE